MKTIIITLILACIMFTGVQAQDVDVQLGEARAAYKSGDLQSTRFALQQALHEIDIAIGAEILKLLPEKMGSMTYRPSADESSSVAVGFAGLFVNRVYETEGEMQSNIQIITDSPMLTAINAILAIPVIGMGDPNQKRVRIGGYRGLMQKSVDETGVTSWDVQIPFGSSLLTFHTSGIDDEKTVTALANTIPVDAIAKLVQ